MNFFKLSIFLAFLCLTSCEDLLLVDKRARELGIQNLSSDSVYSILSQLYPDKLLPIKDELFKQLIAPKDGTAFSRSTESWSKFYEKTLVSDTLSVFFVLVSKTRSAGWEEIRAQNLVEKRIDLSLSDLQKNQFDIIYK